MTHVTFFIIIDDGLYSFTIIFFDVNLDDIFNYFITFNGTLFKKM